MAFKQISSIAFIADSKEDLQTLPFRGMGAECYVIENATEYKQNSKGEWIAQTSSAVSNEGNNAEIEVASQIQADWNQMDNTQVDYIKNKPFGIDYDEKIPVLPTGDRYTPLELPENPEMYTYLVPEQNTGDEHYCYFNLTDGGFELKDIYTNKVIYSLYVLGPGYVEGGGYQEGIYALSNFNNKLISFQTLPIKQLTNLSTVNPVMDPAVTSEGSTEKTGQEAYDYAVAVNNNLLQLIESYNSLIGQLNTKGYVDQR